MFQFIHAADVHLDSPLVGLEQYEGAPVDEIRGASRRALARLVDLAIDREVAFVVIAGDLYDGDWKDHNTGLFFVGQAARLREAGIPLFVISGNHDAESAMTKSLRLPKNPDGSNMMLSHRKVESVRLDDIGAAIHGRGFDQPKLTDNVTDQYPAATPGLFNLGLLHTSLDSESEDQHARYAPCRLADLEAKQYDYWALGHIHQRTVECRGAGAYYSGNLQGRHIRETGAKGCHLVTVDSGGRADVQFEPLDVMRWEHVQLDATDAEDGEALLERFAEQLARLDRRHGGMPLAMRVTVSGRCRVHEQLAGQPAHWRREVQAQALSASGGRVWIEKVRFRTSPNVSLGELLQADGPIAEVAAYFDELRRDDERLLELAGELSELMRRLPDELRTGHEAVDWTRPANVRDLLAEVEPLLLGRLLDEESVS